MSFSFSNSRFFFLQFKCETFNVSSFGQGRGNGRHTEYCVEGLKKNEGKRDSKSRGKRKASCLSLFYINCFIFFNFNFYSILLYNTVLVLPYIDMNQPRVYMSSQS